MKYDTVIVGAGIAGASAALALSARENVLVLEAAEPASGASGVAGGLFSPMLALRGRPIWRIREVTEAFEQQLEEANALKLYDNRGVLRPAHDAQQAEYFVQSVHKCPDYAEWLSPAASKGRFPHIHAPLGAMYTRQAGAVNLAAYVQHLMDTLTLRGVTVRTRTPVSAWGEDDEGAYTLVTHADGATERLRAKRLLLCCGKGFFQPPFLSSLHIHAVKGQTIRVTFPGELNIEDIPPTSGKGYIIPESDCLALGSSFHHVFEDEEPSEDVSEELFQKGLYMLPALENAKIIDAQVGIRVTVPGIRMPLIGRFPGCTDVWVFTAFGSKGLLLAPLLSYSLYEYFHNPAAIPKNVRPRLQPLPEK